MPESATLTQARPERVREPDPGPPAADPRQWAHLAACAGKTQLFYSPPAERPEARAIRELKASLICATCPVIEACRAWAREYREYGYWGGESEEARAAAGYRVRLPNSPRRSRRADPHRAA
jgi:WhiB family transcriptional regulator, redox-sensing transcriptional regulator